MANTVASSGANDTGPARTPHAIVISATKAITATPTPSASGQGRSAVTAAAASVLSAPASSTRCQVREAVLGRSAKLAHTAPLLASCAASGPASVANSSWIAPMPSATSMPLRA